jgi:hypothetical protein
MHEELNLLAPVSPPSLRLRSGQALTFPHPEGRDFSLPLPEGESERGWKSDVDATVSTMFAIAYKHDRSAEDAFAPD